MEDIWFSLETRVRGLMKELLEPSVRRIIESKEITERLSKNQEVYSARLDEIELNIGKFARKSAGIDDIIKRINEFDSSIRLMEVRFGRDREEMKTDINAFGTKIINFEEYLSVFDHMKEAIRNDITNLTYALQVTKSQNEDRFQMFKDEFRDKLMDVEARCVKFEVKLGTYEKNIKSLGREIGENSTLIQTTAHTSEEIIKKNKEIIKSFKHLKKNAFDQIEKLRALSIKQMSEAQVADKKILDIVNNEIPVRMKLMFNDTLFHVFDDPYQKHFVAQVLKEKLLEIRQTDLSQEIHDALMNLLTHADEVLQMPLPEKPDNTLTRVDSSARLTRRRGKQRTIFVVKRESGLQQDSPGLQEAVRPRGSRDPSYGSSALDKIVEERPSNIFSASDMPQQEMPLEPAINYTRKSEMICLKDYDIIKDEIQLARYNTLIRNSNINLEEELANDSSFNSSVSYGPPIDYHPFIEELKNETIVMITELQAIHAQDTALVVDSIAQFKTEVDGKFNATSLAISNSTLEANKNLKELELIVNQALAECTSAITMRKRDQSDFTMEIKSLHQKAEQFENQYSILHERMDTINRSMENICEALRIINILYKQDESDRESIALMGYKETKNKSGKAVISIEKQCLSCTGQASVVLTAFKIACLAYSPSPVNYRDTIFTRKELIDIQAKILHSTRNEKTLHQNAFVEEARAGRSKTASNTKIHRPLSVPSSNFTLQTPRADFSIDSEFPPLKRVPNITLSSINY